MFNNELMADVHFIVGPCGDSQRVPAHKVGNPPAAAAFLFARVCPEDLTL